MTDLSNTPGIYMPTIFKIMLLLLFTCTTHALDKQKTSVPKNDNQTCEALKKQSATEDELARQGCCSSHGGVCGCQGGRV